jgi:cobalamin biosynthesis protein CobD/CbiB
VSDIQKKRKRSIRPIDRQAFYIGILIILPFTVLTFIILLILRDIEFFKDISAIYGAWVGIVIGYFFGSRKVETLIEQVDEFMDKLEITDEENDREYEELKNEKEKIENKYDKAKQQLQHIVSKNLHTLNSNFLNTLKEEHDIIIDEDKK